MEARQTTAYEGTSKTRALNQKFLATKNIESPKERYLEIFRIFRNDFIDEIPEYLLTPKTNPEFAIYKCRKSFFLKIVRYFLHAIESRIDLSASLLVDFENFKVFEEGLRTGEDRKTGENRITAEEIKKANDFLDQAIAELERPPKAKE